MEIHYKDNAQISRRCDEKYNFKLPKYGPSTTDPTYYEPTATRIANMKKSASAMKGVFDFNGKLDGKTDAEKAKNAINQLSGAVVDPRYQMHGLTKEEISQVTMEKSIAVDQMVNKKKAEKESQIKQDKKDREFVDYANKVMSAEKSAVDPSSVEE